MPELKGSQETERQMEWEVEVIGMAELDCEAAYRRRLLPKVVLGVA